MDSMGPILRRCRIVVDGLFCWQIFEGSRAERETLSRKEPIVQRSLGASLVSMDGRGGHRSIDSRMYVFHEVVGKVKAGVGRCDVSWYCENCAPRHRSLLTRWMPIPLFNVPSRALDNKLA